MNTPSYDSKEHNKCFQMNEWCCSFISYWVHTVSMIDIFDGPK